VYRASNSCTSTATNTKSPTRKSARYRKLAASVYTQHFRSSEAPLGLAMGLCVYYVAIFVEILKV